MAEERKGRFSLLRETLNHIVLRILAEGPKHGYEIMNLVEKATNGKWRPAPGTLYPLLESMEKEGLIKVERIEEERVRGGRRVVYRITDKGLKTLAEVLEEKAWFRFAFTEFLVVEGCRLLKEQGLKEEARKICERAKEALAKIQKTLEEVCA